MNNYITIKSQIIKKTFNPATNSSEIHFYNNYSYIPCSYMKDGEPAYEVVKKFLEPRDMTQLDCTTAMIDAGDCQQYYEFVYEMSNEAVLMTRRYKQIPTLMQEVGGVLKVLTLFFVVLSFYYSMVVNKFLFRKVFKVKFSTLVEAKTRIEKNAQNFGPENPRKKGKGESSSVLTKKVKTRENRKNSGEEIDPKLKNFFADVRLNLRQTLLSWSRR